MAAKGIKERVNWRDHTKAELIEVSQDYIEPGWSAKNSVSHAYPVETCSQKRNRYIK